MSSNTFKVSVIIPVYNREHIIASCLESIVNQSLPKKLFEVIVVDDCSVDGTVEAVKSYSDELNLRLISLSENSGGASTPRNIGIRSAQGDYIVFIDSDDVITSNALKVSLELAIKENLDMVILPIDFSGRKPYTNLFEKHSEGFECINLKKDKDKDKDLEHMIFTNPGVVGRLYKRECIKKSGIEFSEKLRVYEDTLFSRFIFAISERIGMLPIDSGEKYIIVPASSEENLSLTKRTVERCVTYILEAITICNKISDEVISKDFKLKIINNSICRNNIYNTVDCLEGYEKLSSNLDILLPLMVKSGVRDKAKNLIEKVCFNHSLSECLRMADIYFKGSKNNFMLFENYIRSWVWSYQTIVLDFYFNGLRVGVDISKEIGGYQLISLVLRKGDDSITIDWQKFGEVRGNHIDLFWHKTIDGFDELLRRISCVLTDLKIKVEELGI